MGRACKGCGSEISPGRRERNRRKWCSEACRVKFFRSVNPEYVLRQAELSSERHRATYEPVRHHHSCAMCGVAFESRSSVAKYCSDRCRYRSHYLGRRGRKAGVVRDSYTIDELAARDSWICQLCLGDLRRDLTYPHPFSISVDHVVPLSRGGNDTRDNVQLAHLVCNQRKGSRVA